MTNVTVCLVKVNAALPFHAWLVRAVPMLSVISDPSIDLEEFHVDYNNR